MPLTTTTKTPSQLQRDQAKDAAREKFLNSAHINIADAQTSLKAAAKSLTSAKVNRDTEKALSAVENAVAQLLKKLETE